MKLRNIWNTIRDSFRWIVMDDYRAYERLLGDKELILTEKDYDRARVIKGLEGYALVVGKETVKTYARKSDAIRGAKRQGFAVITAE